MLARSCVHAFGPRSLASSNAIRYDAEKHFTVGLLLTGLTMAKTLLVFVAFLSFGLAQAQQPPPGAIPQAALRPFAAAAPVQQVVNLGDVVINVVIAKVLGDGDDSELIIAKFGGTEANTASGVVITYQVETRQRNVVVNGETKVLAYEVRVPVTTLVNKKENFTPTEQNRSVPVSAVQAFDLKGNPLEAAEWTKRLETPKHVLLLRDPINETNRLNPFYSAILRDDMLLLFLKGNPVDKREAVDDRMTMRIYNAMDLPVWSKDGQDLDPNSLVDLIKSMNPTTWLDKASIVLDPANQRFVVTANRRTHEELSLFFKSLRDEFAKQEKE